MFLKSDADAGGLLWSNKELLLNSILLSSYKKDAGLAENSDILATGSFRF